MRKCKECGAILPCVNESGICKECDEQFEHCYYKCKYPCRDRAEQREMFNKLKEGWNEQKGGKK